MKQLTETTDLTRDMITHVMAGNAFEAQEHLNAILELKIANALQVAKEEVAQSLYVEDSEPVDESLALAAAATFAGAALGGALGVKGNLYAIDKTRWEDGAKGYMKNFVKGIVDPRTYFPEKKKQKVAKPAVKEEVEQVQEIAKWREGKPLLKSRAVGIFGPGNAEAKHSDETRTWVPGGVEFPDSKEPVQRAGRNREDPLAARVLVKSKTKGTAKTNITLKNKIKDSLGKYTHHTLPEEVEQIEEISRIEKKLANKEFAGKYANADDLDKALDRTGKKYNSHASKAAQISNANGKKTK